MNKDIYKRHIQQNKAFSMQQTYFMVAINQNWN